MGTQSRQPSNNPWKIIYHLRGRKRYRRLSTVLFKYGLGHVLTRKLFPGKDLRLVDRGVLQKEAKQMRCLLEELGPTFIKLGQLLSTRPDLVPPGFAEELENLQDRVPGFGPQKVRQQIVKELGRPPERIFLKFDYTPLASASIGQVHRAELPGGEEVAVKVRRPDLEKQVREDLLVLQEVAEYLADSPSVASPWDFKEIVAVFAQQINREMDFTAEGLNMEAFRDFFAFDDNIRLPVVYWDYCSNGILTMEYVPARRIEEIETGLSATEKGRELARQILRVVMLPFFRTGNFYGDPHAGNLMFSDWGLVLFDFGIVARIDADFRYQIAQLLLAVSQKNIERVMELTVNLGHVTRPVRKEYLYEDLAEIIAKSNNLNRTGVKFAEILNGMLQISLRHGIKMPGAFYSLGRAVLAGEGLATRLDPEINVVETVRPLAEEYLKERLMPQFTPEKLFDQISQWQEKYGDLPRDLAGVAHRLAEGELAIEFVHKGLDELYDKLDVVSTRMSVGIITGSLLAGSAVILSTLQPRSNWFTSLAAACFMLAMVMGFWMVWGMLRHGRLR